MLSDNRVTMQGLDDIIKAEPASKYGLESRVMALTRAMDTLSNAVDALESRLTTVLVPMPQPGSEPVDETPQMSTAAEAVEDNVRRAESITSHIEYLMRSLDL